MTCRKKKFLSKGESIAFQQINSGTNFWAYECTVCKEGTWHITTKGIPVEEINEAIINNRAVLLRKKPGPCWTYQVEFSQSRFEVEYDLNRKTVVKINGSKV